MTRTFIYALIYNENLNFSLYSKFKNLIRPFNMDYTAKIKYYFFNDEIGKGIFQARLTAASVFITSVCKKALEEVSFFQTPQMQIIFYRSFYF